jgi:hypothetical protein
LLKLGSMTNDHQYYWTSFAKFIFKVLMVLRS